WACRGRQQDLAATHSVQVLMGAALLMRRGGFDEGGPGGGGDIFGGGDIDLCDRVNRRHRVIYCPRGTLVPFCRGASRPAIWFAHQQTVAGITRYLRRSGASSSALCFYKAAVTLDAPLQWLGLAVQYLWRRLCGRREQAKKSLRSLHAVGHFLLRGVFALWRA